MAIGAVEAQTERLLPEILEALNGTGDALRTIIDTVYEDQEITDAFAGATIQCDTVRATVAKMALAELKQIPELQEALNDKDINVMIIGDTEPPELVREIVHGGIDEIADEKKAELVEELGQSYNLDGRSPEGVREEFFDYIDRHYDFPPELKEKFVKNSSLVPGGMSALRLILGQTMIEARNEDKDTEIISTDTSFDMFWDIAEKTAAGNNDVEFVKLPTQQKNLLHLTPEDVDEFYEIDPKASFKDCWYMTPVSNYPCTKVEPSSLLATCQRIIHHDPDARIIMDCVYVRILKDEESKDLMKFLLSDPKVLDRIVFIESFSKSHGMAGRRLGAYFTANDGLFNSIHAHDRALGQGHPYDVYSNISAITALDKDQEKLLRNWHELWGAERKGLYGYLIKSGNYDELFHEDQSHILEEQLDSTVGIYLSLRLQDSVSARDVLAETGIAGIEFKGSGGTFVRFSVGKITEPTYAGYGYEKLPEPEGHPAHKGELLATE